MKNKFKNIIKFIHLLTNNNERENMKTNNSQKKINIE